MRYGLLHTVKTSLSVGECLAMIFVDSIYQLSHIFRYFKEYMFQVMVMFIRVCFDTCTHNRGSMAQWVKHLDFSES